MSYNPVNSNGQKTSANSSPVVIASDQSAVPFIGSLTTGTNPIGKVAVDQTTNIIAANIMQNAAVALGNGVNLNVQGFVSALISVTGTMSGGTAITFEASVDDVNFVAITGHQIGFAGNLTTVTISPGDFRFSCAGYKSIRARISAYSAGTITAKGYVSALSGHPTTINSNIIAALPVGTNIVGKFGIDQTTPGTTNLVAISGTVPVSQKAATSTSATLQAAAVVTGNGSVISTDGMSAATFTVSGTYVGTINFEGTEDGTTYTAISTTQLGTTIISTTTTTVGVFEASVAGLLNVRARLTWTSGTSVTVTAHAVPVNFATRNVNANIVSSVALTVASHAVTNVGTFAVQAASKDTFATDTALTITLAALANSAVGVGRQSTLVDNTTNRYQSTLVWLSIKAGTTPTPNSAIFVYLLRSNNNAPLADDAAGAVDAALTVINASLLGTMNVATATTGAVYVASFDTSILGPLGPKWGIALVNNSGVALDATEANHVKTFIGITRS